MLEIKKQGNRAIQVRLHEDILKKVDKKARDAGYITPAGKANIAGYVASLIMKDLNTMAIIIDGKNNSYDVK
jgi:ribosomal protein S25